MNQKVILQAQRCTSFWQKSVGMLAYKKPITIYFETRFGIHTFGLKLPIDVVILNKKNQVIKLFKNLKPNQIFLWNPLYKKVIEMPEGYINKKNIAHGTTIIVQM
ncbi:MAG TPA: DUF192 domain-containing protein [Patescibacteria group bacterium]